jgi:hypothetical protein
MVDKYFFFLGLANSILLIFIFVIRKNHLALVQSYGWIYLLLALPALYLLSLVQQHEKSIQYTIFLLVFLAFLALEGLYDFVLKLPFRDNWKLLAPYLVLYYAMNYGFVVMPWKSSMENGIILLVLFLVQIVANFVTH